MKIAIVIPTYNEEKTISKVIKNTSIYGDVIIVNDCSDDNTRNIASNLECIIIDNTFNLGYGMSIQNGLKYCIENNYTYAITIDADDQHNEVDIKKIIHFLQDGYDLVIGSRNILQRHSEYIFSFITNIVWNVKDPLSGLKGYKLEKTKGILSNNLNDNVGVDLAIKLIKNNTKVMCFDIETKERKDISRFGTGLIPNLKIYFSIFKAFFNFF